MNDLQILKLHELNAQEVQSINGGYYSVPSSGLVLVSNFNTGATEGVLSTLFSSAELLLSIGGIVAEYF